MLGIDSLLWFLLVYALLTSLYSVTVKKNEEFDIWGPLKKQEKGNKFGKFLAVLSWISLVLGTLALVYYIVTIFDSPIGLICVGVVILGYAIYCLKKNNYIDKIASTLTDNTDREKLAERKSLFPAVALTGCILLLVLGVLFYISDRKDVSSDDNMSSATITSLQEMGTISTVLFSVKEIIEPEKKWSDDILYSLRAEVEAGIDLNKINSNSIRVENKGKRVKIRIPYPEIISVNIRLDSMKVEYAKTSAYKRSINAEDRRAANVKFENEIYSNESRKEFLQQAEAPTLSFVRAMLHDLNFEDIDLAFEQ